MTVAVADYILLRSWGQAESAIRELMNRKVIGLDFETTGIDPRRDVPLLLGMDEYILPCYQMDGWPELVKSLVESKDTIKIEYNANFEGMVFESVGIRQRRVLDPMLGDMLLHNGRPQQRGYFTLGQALWRYLYVEHDKTLQTSFIGADPATFVPTDEQLQYLRRDVGYLSDLAEAVSRKVAEAGMMGTWKLENQYSQVLAQMQYHGVLVDVDGYRQELEKVNAEFDDLERAVSEKLTPYILEVRRRKYQALKGPYDAWINARARAYAAIESEKEAKKSSGSFATGQAARDWELEQQRIWKAEHPKPPVAKMNHGAILVTSPDQIHTALNEMGIQVENIEKETLILARAGRPADQVELLKDLGELSVAKKIRSNEGPKLLDHRLYEGNRLTTRFAQLRARTGRISSSKWSDGSRCDACDFQQQADPDGPDGAITCVNCGRVSGPKTFGRQWGSNNQNLTPRFKRYVKPGSGRKFVIYDYSQIELRVAAELILRENPTASDMLIKAFRDGMDPHSLTGEEVTGIPYAEFYRRAVEDKEPDMVLLRRGMKVVNFGAMFGFAAPAMAVKIYVDTGDTTPFGDDHIRAAQKRLDAFWSTNPTLAALRDRIGASAISDGFTETLGGRKRFYDLKGLERWQINAIKRQAVSTKIQGTAADIAKEAQNLIYDAIADCDPDAWLWCAVHDEIAMECLEEDADEWNCIMPALMTSAFELYINHIPCGIDGGIQDTWSH